MAHKVLGIGYQISEYAAIRREWQPHEVVFDFVDSISEATQYTKQKNYVCATMFVDRIDNGQLAALRGDIRTPILLLSRAVSIVERRKFLENGIAQLIPSIGQNYNAGFISSGKNAVQYYLEEPEELDRQVTIVSNEDLFFCLEYRTVEVRGQRIDLTPKEFDILALLITHPKQVFPYSRIIDLIWDEAVTQYSRKVLANHICRLRNKLLTQPDIPNYIISIRGIGYKYEAS